MHLQEFDIEFKYRKGKANADADCLSRIKGPEEQKVCNFLEKQEERDTNQMFAIFRKLPSLRNNIDQRYQQNEDENLKEIMKFLQGETIKAGELRDHLLRQGKQYVMREGVHKYFNGEEETLVLPKQLR